MSDREKVIEGLEQCASIHQNFGCESCIYPGVDCAIDDAIVLLKSLELSDDWISRNRLKEEIQYYIDEAGWGEVINKALGWCLEFIDNQEAVKWK